MKFLAKLERTAIGWWLIALCLLFFVLRFPSFIEPYWYGDEGIYEVIGQSMDHGRLLYRDIWDNKPPLLYVVYALAQGDQPTIKILSLVAGIVSLVIFFFLSQKIVKKTKLSLLLSLLYVLLLGTPLLEGNIANAEDFILLPILLAGLLIYQLAFVKTNKPHLSLLKTPYPWAGLLLGIAFLFKIVAIFDTIAFILFLYFLKRIPTKQYVLSFLAGFLAPFLVIVLYFLVQGGLVDFIQSAFFGNIDYVGWQNSFLGIPQGLLILKTILLLALIFLIYKKRKLFSEPVLFVFLWFLFSLYNVFFSERPYTHYVIILLPSFCLLLGLLITNQTKRIRQVIAGSLLVSLVILYLQFHFDFKRPYEYYQNALQFVTGHKDIENYQSFFDPKVPRDYAVATFIQTHTKSSDNVYLWGNNPQIYALSHKLPLGKYTVAYHVNQDIAVKQTQHALNKGKPKYIIILTETQPLPFNIPLYIMRYSITGATIYERSF